MSAHRQPGTRITNLLASTVAPLPRSSNLLYAPPPGHPGAPFGSLARASLRSPSLPRRGDWITPHGSEGTVSSPENLLFNNCYLHYITHLVSKIAAILNKDADATKYAADADRIAAAVNKA